MWQFETEFSKIIQRTPTIKSFRFPIRTNEAPFKPGQFFFVTIKVQGLNKIHHFSFSSSPTESDYIEFTKRITSHDYSQALDRAKQGTWADIKGPYGNFILPTQKQPIAFLTGGIGITPMMSMLRYILDTDLNYDMVLIYGNQSYRDIAFYKELREISNLLPSLRVEHVLSEVNSHSEWEGKRGFINRNLIIETIPDYKDRFFYISGPPKMVASLIEQLNSIKISKEQIKRDSFTGYD